MKYKVGDIVESEEYFGSEHKLAVISFAGFWKRPTIKVYRFSYITGDQSKVESFDILASLFETESSIRIII